MADESKDIHYKDRNKNDAFAGFEPYWCGIGSPDPDTYKELIGGAVGDLKLQHYDPTNNPFEGQTSTDKFKFGIGNESGKYTCIEGAARGTCPKAGDYLRTLGLSQNDINPFARYEDNIRLSLTEDGILVQIMTSDFKSIKSDTRFTIDSFETRKLDRVPTKLGVLIVAGGGGAGGSSWLDSGKEESQDDDYCCPGSGGGGGGFSWAVLDMSKAVNGNYFWIKVGKGGVPGKNAKREGASYGHPNHGDNGGDGNDSWIGFGENVEQAANLTWEDYGGTVVSGGNVLLAKGGKGGKFGRWENIKGGEGGPVLKPKTTSSAAGKFFIKGQHAGGAAGSLDQSSVIIKGDDEGVPTSDALYSEISFLLDESGADKKTYTTIVNNPALAMARRSEG